MLAGCATPRLTNSEMVTLVEQFVAVTGCEDAEIAQTVLEAHNGRIDAAVDYYFATLRED